jgi:hypothetical protein
MVIEIFRSRYPQEPPPTYPLAHKILCELKDGKKFFEKSS